MRIHTDHLSEADLFKALYEARDMAPNVDLIVQGTYGSRSHRQAFRVALRGTGVRHTRHPNTGITGAGSEYAATHDDWGWFAAAVFALDESAIVGPYKGTNNFHKQTKDAYVKA